MNKDLYEKYMRLRNNLEEPIREIVPAIWQLPYVVDTRHCCSGHVITQRTDGFQYWEKSSPLTPERIRNGWYTHRATLQIDFSLEETLTEERDAFIEALYAVYATSHGRILRFGRSTGYLNETQVSFQRRARSRSFGEPLPPKGPDEVYCVSYDAHLDTLLKEAPKTIETVEQGEALLSLFWEEVAKVIRQYNPAAEIGQIQGKNYRHSITWAEWQSVFPHIFDPNIKKPEFIGFG